MTENYAALSAARPSRQALWPSLVRWSRERHDRGAAGLWLWPSGLLVPVRMRPGKDDQPRFLFRVDTAKPYTFRADIDFDTVATEKLGGEGAARTPTRCKGHSYHVFALGAARCSMCGYDRYSSEPSK